MDDALDPLIHQGVRLRLMALLHKNRDAAFTWLQTRLGVTPGNLDSHAKRLAEAGYVTYGRALTATGFENRISITRRGDEAFRAYRRALVDLLEVEGASARQKTDGRK